MAVAANAVPEVSVPAKPTRLTSLLLWSVVGGAGIAALCGLAFGMAGFALICSWMWFFGAVAFLPFLIGMAAFPALTGYTLAILRTARVQGPWIEGVVWVVFEGLRSRVPFGGMPWATAGSALAPLSLIHI